MWFKINVYVCVCDLCKSCMSLNIRECIADVTICMYSNTLQLSANKTQVTWCTSSRRQHQLSRHTVTLLIDGVPGAPRCRLFATWNLYRRSPGDSGYSRRLSLYSGYIASADGRSGHRTSRLRRCRLDRHSCLPVAATTVGPAGMIFGLRRSDHVSHALISLRWLRTSQPIQFKVATFRAYVYKVLHGCAPSYLRPLACMADQPSRQPSAPPAPAALSGQWLTVLPSAADSFQSPVLRSGMVCRWRCRLRHPSKLSADVWLLWLWQCTTVTAGHTTDSTDSI